MPECSKNIGSGDSALWVENWKYILYDRHDRGSILWSALILIERALYKNPFLELTLLLLLIVVLFENIYTSISNKC